MRNNTEEAFKIAKKALGVHIYGMEMDEEIIPLPSEVKDIRLKNNQSIILIDVYMLLIRYTFLSMIYKKRKIIRCMELV